MDDVRFYGACTQPAGKPQAVAPGLEGDSDARDRATGLLGFIAPALQQLQQATIVPSGAMATMSNSGR